MKRLVYLAPMAVFVVVALFFYRGLQLDPKKLPSVLIDRPVPELDLPPVPGRDEEGLKRAHLLGEVTLVNIFGSWCVACLAEHPLLLKIQESGVAPVHGIDWNEKNPEDGARWLKRNGDPYARVGLDMGPPESHAAIDFGVTGAPETFVVDAEGRIRYKHIGPITAEVWEQTLKPMIEELSQP